MKFCQIFVLLMDLGSVQVAWWDGVQEGLKLLAFPESNDIINVPLAKCSGRSWKKNPQ